MSIAGPAPSLSSVSSDHLSFGVRPPSSFVTRLPPSCMPHDFGLVFREGDAAPLFFSNRGAFLRFFPDVELVPAPLGRDREPFPWLVLPPGVSRQFVPSPSFVIAAHPPPRAWYYHP